VEPRPHAHTAESRELSPHAPIPRLIACLTLLITAPAHAQTKAGDLVWQNQFDLAGEALECLRELGWIRAEVAIARDGGRGRSAGRRAPPASVLFDECWPHGSRARVFQGAMVARVNENSHL
jgi:hypothetical protein